MKLNGNKFVIPIFDAELSSHDSYELCDGISLFSLSEDYGQYLRKTPELIARYGDSLPNMKTGLVIETGKLKNGDKLDWHKLFEFSVFIAMTIRLSTGVPIDIPYWFDVDDDEIKECGNTLHQTYRNGNRYLYPLDKGKQSSGLIALKSGLSEIAQRYILDKNKNVLIRAIEFAAIGFQTRHIPSRLVNNTIFLESLFTCGNAEISFQIASSISWYLNSEVGSEERLNLFSKIKTLYGYRSKIVHGSDISSKNRNLMDNLLFSEELNTDIIQRILVKQHVGIFSMKENKRQEEIKALTLGAACGLLENIA